MANEHFSPTAAIEYVKCNTNIEDRTQTGFTQSSDVTSECFSGSVIARTQTADFVRGQCVNQRQFYNQILRKRERFMESRIGMCTRSSLFYL
jgi:hypothetical protein